MAGPRPRVLETKAGFKNQRLPFFSGCRVAPAGFQNQGWFLKPAFGFKNPPRPAGEMLSQDHLLREE